METSKIGIENHMKHKRYIGLFTLVGLLAVGCGSGGNLVVKSVAEQSVQLKGQFTQGVYGFDDKNTLHVLLLEGDSQDPASALYVQMHWRPRPGRTPIAAHATNASLHYVVFGETTGVYGGGGFLFLNNKPGGPSFSADVRQATLRLQDSSQGFDDVIGLAQAKGKFNAKRDDVLVQRMLRQLHVRLGEELGYPLLIGANR